MSESSSYSTQHTSRWLNMQLSSDSDLQHTSNNRNTTSTSTLCTHTIQPTSLFEDDVNSQISESSTSNSKDLYQGQDSSAIQSSWLQLQLSSEDSSEIVSDIDYNKEDSVSQNDDLSDILEEYIQSHGLLSDIEDSLSQSDGDDPADDYQPGSAEECGPAWIKTSQADNSADISEVQDNIKSPVNVDPLLNLARPTLWLPALEQLHTLNPQMSIGNAVLNFFLMTKWSPKHGQGPLRYADMMAVAPMLVNNMEIVPDLKEIQTFQQRHFLSSSQEHPPTQVGFIFTISQHYWVAIFDYRLQTAHILGHHITSMTQSAINTHSNWETWHGPSYWKKLALLHGWPHGDVAAVHVYEDSRFYQQQTQNCDCGAISCALLEHFLEEGLSYHLDGSLQLPVIPCGHTIRLRILEMVKLSCRRQWSHYLYIQSSLPHDWDHTDHISQQVLQARLKQPQQMAHTHQAIITQLATLLYNCPDCRLKLVQTRAPATISSDDSSPEDPDPEDNNPITNLTLSSQMTPNLKQLLDSHSLTTGTHFRDTTNMPSRWQPFDARFDQYWGGPTLESMQPIMDAGEIWSSSRSAWISGLGSAMLFRDYGYRILPSFSQMFWLGPPVDTLDCMMRIGVSDSYDPSWQVGHWRAESHGLSRSSMFPDERRVVPSDVRIMAASEMLMDAQRLASEKKGVYETLFVYGTHPIGGQRIILDLELDMDVPDEITVSVDIDSYIWVTSDFSPALSLGIYLAPVIDHQAPIHKHNHIYVDILIPQSADDQGPDGTERKEWWTKSVPLSSIPHVPFGMLSTANHASNLLLFFPRMIHNRTNSSLKATRIPLDVIDLFWNEVVLPSISQEAPNSSLPYVDTTVHEIRYKSRKGRSGQSGSQDPRLLLSPSHI
ncbi:hypothetical protein BD769DRAFT_1669167 [Suillus cothurnatus]|nr:hypothetical protein BD769DRAFT_1669167 [Suillus cothurnatus]